MFEQSIIPATGTNKTWTVTLAFLGQLAVVGGLLLLPLLYLQPLPAPELTTLLVAPPPPPPPPPAPAEQIARVVPRPFAFDHLYAPRTIPKTIAMIHDLPQAPRVIGVAGIPGGVPGGKVGGVLGSILNALPQPTPLPPPPPQAKRAPAPKPKPAMPTVIKLGGDVEAAQLISAPHPVYPAVARAGRIQGTVRMEAIIGKDGHIESLHAISGNPLLVGAAMRAVKQWVYRPTYLDQKPVQVDTEIDVHFRLST